MSGRNTNPFTVERAASICQLPADLVEEVYPCTPQQIIQISESRSEVFHLILFFGPDGDMERWIRCVREVVALNSILRARIVLNQCQYFQVVTKEEHVTEHVSGNLEDFLEGAMPHDMSLKQPLFRTTAIGAYFVVTMHHAIMDYWSLNSFLRGDAAMLYLGHEPIVRAPFKDFVSLCASIDRTKADSFWASRFNGFPSTFPTVSADTIARPSGKLEKTMTLELTAKGIPESHIAWYAEAAWAMTIAAYVDNESVSYGIVMSGRSPALGDAGNTLGPTTVEVPVQVNVQPNMTLDFLVKGRASALRELKSEPLLLQYGLPNIAATSEAAGMASSFQSLFNIVPPQPISLPAAEGQEKSVTLQNIVKRSRGGFALTFNCRLVEDDIMLEALYDPAILAPKQMQRMMNQFEHDLLNLIQVSPSTRVSRLQRLNLHDRLDILGWNAAMSQGSYNPLLTDKLLDEVWDRRLLNLIEMACGVWVTNPTNTDVLVPIGSIGELLIEVPKISMGKGPNFGVDFQSMSPSPVWFKDLCGDSTHLLRTGHLVRYNHDGDLLSVGRQQNRIKIAGRTLQLEQVEDLIGTSGQVSGIVVVPKIVLGRTKLVAVLTLTGKDDQDSHQEPLQQLEGTVSQEAKKCLAGIQEYTKSHLPGVHVPAIWHVVGRLPQLEHGGLDRAEVQRWLKLPR